MPWRSGTGLHAGWLGQARVAAPSCSAFGRSSALFVFSASDLCFWNKPCIYSMQFGQPVSPWWGAKNPQYDATLDSWICLAFDCEIFISSLFFIIGWTMAMTQEVVLLQWAQNHSFATISVLGSLNTIKHEVWLIEGFLMSSFLQQPKSCTWPHLVLSLQATSLLESLQLGRYLISGRNQCLQVFALPQCWQR